MPELAETPIARKPRERARSAPNPNAFAFTIPDAQALGAPGCTTIYKLFSEGRLKKVKVGNRTLVEGDSLRRLLRGEATPAPARPADAEALFGDA